ncbi:MAG: hypothetical protein O2822_05705, partial [Chloroflexi bacterium]|nr:hypothetical protein [Chloroflexota bacterium]
MGTWVGRYAMVDGQVREHGPWLVDRRREREDETIRLLVLAEPVDRRSAEFCSEVAEAVAALFARESLSITGGLLRALQQAHTNLAEWNRRSLREHRVAVGVTCVVIREGEATIAQVGPSVAYLSGPQGITRLATEDLPAAAPLGGNDEIEPRFTSTGIAGREVLLLTSTVEKIIGVKQVQDSLAAGPEAALAELFRRTREVTDMTAVLVADLDIEDGAGMPPPLDLDEDEDEDEDDVAGREIALPGIDSGNRTPAPRVPAPVEGGSRRRPWSGPQAQPIPFPSIRRPARTVGRTPLESQLPWRWIGIAEAALLALALLAWAIGPGLLSEDREAELTRVVTTAQEQLSAAQGAQRADDRRAALQAVLVSTEQARALAPDDPRVRQIEAQAQSQLAVMDAVSDVSALAPLLKFEGAVTAPVTPQSVVAGGRSLWFIETGRGRLFRMDAGSSPSTPEEVYRAGATYGGTPARDPVSIAWDAQGNRLLLLDAGRGLFAITEASKTPVPVPLRGSGELRSAVAISVYLRNLYILDPAGGEVWRYLPASDGYDSERSGMLGGIDIGTATGLVVSADVFVVDQGRLRQHWRHKETAPMLDGIDQPPKAPVALVEDAQRGLLFLADRGNKRIVVGDREGRFLKQYRHPSLADLRGLAISADGSRLYVLSGDGITYFDVAPAGPPPTQPA